MELNGALWHSIEAKGIFSVGPHMDTTPLDCPTHKTPLYGLCFMTDILPAFVFICPAICPMDMSNHDKYPASL